MRGVTGFRIDWAENFEHLSNAPVVEAVIHWRARPTVRLSSAFLREKLQEHLSEYTEPGDQHEILFETGLNVDGVTLNPSSGWHGLRIVSNDGRFVAQFTRNGFLFSRLKPYEDWNRFHTEAIRLWTVYAELARPLEIDRLGVRFINVIALRTGEVPGQILKFLPATPDTFPLPVSEFMYQTQYEIPQYGYQLNVIQTIQRHAVESQVILDLDVFTSASPGATDENMSQQLLEMQWIKNKAFFSFIAESAMSRFTESQP